MQGKCAIHSLRTHIEPRSCVDFSTANPKQGRGGGGGSTKGTCIGVTV